MTLSLNPDYMVQGLEVMTAAADVTMHVSQPNQAIKIAGEPGFVYVVMPVTLRNA